MAGRIKYYFSPSRGMDRFYIGVQGGINKPEFSGQNFGIGFDVGYKICTRNRVVLEVSLGLFRTRDEILAVPTLNVGYRL